MSQQPIPAIALSAFGLARQLYDQQLAVLSAQTRKVMGLDETWTLNIDTGFATKEEPTNASS